MAETQATTEKKCKIENCKRPYRAKGYCNIHFRKWRRGELEKKPRYKICGEEKCKAPLFRAGYCEKHYEAWVASRKGEDKGPDASASAPATETPTDNGENKAAPDTVATPAEEKVEKA